MAWEKNHGPIPDGMVIDHVCRVRRCVNTDHMEVVTNKENILRGQSPWAVNARKTHCPRGHPLEDGNVRVRTDKNGALMRECLTCAHERSLNRKFIQNPERRPSSGERTHCPAGHPYDEENTYYTPKGHRRCRQCHREERRASYHAAKANH